jgi:hypothetical protein
MLRRTFGLNRMKGGEAEQNCIKSSFKIWYFSPVTITTIKSRMRW